MKGADAVRLPIAEIRLDGGTQPGLVATLGNIIQDHPGNQRIRLKCLIAAHQRSYRAPHPGCIDHQQDGSL